MKTRLIVFALWAIGMAMILVASHARAQDTFVPTGLKSTCEWLSGTDCARVGRPRTRIVRVPVTTMRPMRHVPEHLAPLHSRREEVRGWRGGRRYSPEGPRCWPVAIKAYSDEKIARDAGLEAQRRWSGIVRSELGERYMDFAKASTKREECWQSSTEERTIDKATSAIKGAVRRSVDAVTGRERDEEDGSTGSHQRCMVEARPCRAEKTKEGDDDDR